VQITGREFIYARNVQRVTEEFYVLRSTISLAHNFTFYAQLFLWHPISRFTLNYFFGTQIHVLRSTISLAPNFTFYAQLFLWHLILRFKLKYFFWHPISRFTLNYFFGT